MLYDDFQLLESLSHKRLDESTYLVLTRPVLSNTTKRPISGYSAQLTVYGGGEESDGPFCQISVFNPREEKIASFTEQSLPSLDEKFYITLPDQSEYFIPIGPAAGDRL